MLRSVERRRDVDARFYKPACLLAVIDGIADGSLAPSDLDPDRVCARFNTYLKDIFPDRANLGWRPFWHLSRDGAWIFRRDGQVVGPEDFKRQRKPNSRRELLSQIDLVAVPQQLRRHWRSPADRAELRAAVISMLRRDNLDCRRVADRLNQDRLLAFPTDQVSPEIVIDMGSSRAGGRQGFHRSAVARRAVEAQAMQIARDLLVEQGWDVEDVSTRRCYDLHCTRGAATLFVEVKGTTSAGEEIMLTAGEVAFAIRHRQDMMLIVVVQIELGERDGDASASGGHAHFLPAWAPAPGDLDPVSYYCRVSLPE